MRLFIFLFLITSFIGCIETPNSFERIPPGIWRGELYLKSTKLLLRKTKKLLTQKEDNAGRMDEIPEGILPFQFEVKYKENKKDFDIVIINGSERIPVGNIKYGFDKRIARDTMVIDFPVYQSYIEATYEDGVLEGFWHVKTRESYKIPFKANFGKNYRFNNLRQSPVSDLSGNWKTTFSPDTDNQFLALGEFQQKGNHLTATFATEAGDFRFLEGTIQNNKIYLSAFDGSHAFLFLGEVLKNGELAGTFYSGTHYSTAWKSIRDDEFKLHAPDKITYVTDPTANINFSFPNEKGEIINFQDPKYDNKVKLIKIMGTWCPNCMDETKFLVDYLKKHPSKDLEIFALAYEKNKGVPAINKLLSTYKSKYDIPYEVLYAGPVDKKLTAKQFPMLNGISSYPTMIYVGKHGKIRKIYTGFYGPATSEYKNFTKEFEKTIEQLLAE